MNPLPALHPPRFAGRRAATVVPLLAAAALAACSGVPVLPGFTPYRMEIQQGNFVSQEMASRLKPGMTREQVRFVLGTPLVADVFHTDRWDYVFMREPQGGGAVERRRLSVFFKEGRLARVEGDVVPQKAAENAAGDVRLPAANP
jgi:outer membrane protein assembly factor BamE